VWDLRTLHRLNEERVRFLKKNRKDDITLVATKTVATIGEKDERLRRSESDH
jgi:hypothetical protein